VRTVVDDVARRRVGEGAGAAAEERAPLEERHARPGADEPDRRGEPGEAAADDRDVRRRHPASQ
jgi:hypothetical protein